MRWILSALLLASLLIGFGQVAALPPFEGIDEEAHYSYIEQIAKGGPLPRLGDPVRLDLQKYVDFWSTIPGPPVRALRYHNLFSADAETIKKMREAVKTARVPSTGEAGDWQNSEVQHPPFYYVALAPFYLLSQGWSLAGQLVLLRGLSYLAAWLSLCLAVFAAAKVFPESVTRRAMMAAPALWPFVFPGWFPEMARLGNDSLVALLVACAVAIVVWGPIRRWSAWLLLGIICGLGALTKFTYLPFLVALALLLLYRVVRWREASVWQFLGFLATAFVVAGWWYFQRSLETGMLFATPEGLELKEKGGLITGLMQHFSVDALAWVIPAAGMSFIWSGTWSFVTPPLTALAPLVATSLLVGFVFLYRLYNYRMHNLVRLAALTLGFWVIAITYPTAVLMALYGRLPLGDMGYGGQPGYYLHSFAPALAPVISLAILTVSQNWLARKVAWVLLGYNVVFLFGATFMQFLYFAGCGSNGSARFNIASASVCWNDWQRLTDNLDTLAFPLVAFCLVLGGVIALAAGALPGFRLASSSAIQSSDPAYRRWRLAGLLSSKSGRQMTPQWYRQPNF